MQYPQTVNIGDGLEQLIQEEFGQEAGQGVLQGQDQLRKIMLTVFHYDMGFELALFDLQ